jgi:hypothetical protein
MTCSGPGEERPAGWRWPSKYLPCPSRSALSGRIAIATGFPPIHASSAMARADNPTASPTWSHVITFGSPGQLTPRYGGWARIGVAAVGAVVSPSAAGSRAPSPPHAASAIDSDAKSAGILTPAIRRDPLGKSRRVAKGARSGVKLVDLKRPHGRSGPGMRFRLAVVALALAGVVAACSAGGDHEAAPTFSQAP